MVGCRINRAPVDSNIALLHINYCHLIPKPDNYLQAKPDSWGFRKFISTDFLKSRASQWLPEDNLTIVCDVSIIGDNFVTHFFWSIINDNIGLSRVVQVCGGCLFKLSNYKIQEERGHYLGQNFLRRAQEVKSQGTSVTSRYP